jgi:ABC-2 type transport system permease protein
MSARQLVWHQIRFDQKVFWRNPAAVFFTVMLPIIFLFIFATIFGNSTVRIHGHVLKVSTYYVPGIMALAVISATLVSLAINLTREREDGLLKRSRGTPLPSWIFVAGRVGNSIVISLIMVVLVTALGRLVYGVKIPTSTVPAIVVTLAVGAAAFCCLGFALTRLIPSEQAAPAVTNAVVLPLYFLSGVFIPQTEIPAGVLTVAGVFPIRNLFLALLTAFDPATAGSGFEWGHLAVVAAWGLFGLLIAVRTFRWTPRAG